MAHQVKDRTENETRRRVFGKITAKEGGNLKEIQQRKTPGRRIGIVSKRRRGESKNNIAWNGLYVIRLLHDYLERTFQGRGGLPHKEDIKHQESCLLSPGI